MSNIADISDGLLKMEDELKSFHEVVELVDEAKATATSTIEASNRLNAAAQELTKNVGGLVLNIHNLDLDNKIELLNNLTTSLHEDINSVSSQVTSLGENSKMGVDYLDSRLDERIQTMQTEMHDGLLMLNSEIKGRIESFEAEVERLNKEANSFHQKSQLESERVDKFLLVLTILGSLAVLLLIIFLIMNIA